MTEPVNRMAKVILRVVVAGALILLALLLLAPTAAAQDCPATGIENHIYVFPDSLSLTPGATLEARGADGTCAGVAVYPDAGAVAMPVFGVSTDDVTYLRGGDAITLYADGQPLTVTEEVRIGDMDPGTYQTGALTVVTSATLPEPDPVPVTLAWASDTVRVYSDTWRVALEIDAPDRSRIDGLRLTVQGARSVQLPRAEAADTLAQDTLRSWSFGADVRSGSVLVSGDAPSPGQTAEVYLVDAGVSMDEGTQPTDVLLAAPALTVERADPVLAGDVTGDGAVAWADVVRLVQYLNFPQSAALDDAQLAAADVDGDGAVTEYDVWRLFYLIQ